MKLWLVRTVFAALGCIAVSAATFLSEPFPYPDASALTGTAGSPWTTLTGTAGELTVSGGTLSLSPAGSESVRAPLADGPHAATTLWTSFDLRASALPTATGAVFGQLIDASGSPRAGIVATTDGAASGSYRLLIGSAGLAPSATVLPLDLATGQTYQVVVRYLPLTGATTLWVNPTHAEATIHTVTASDLSPVSSGINAFQWIQSADAGTLVVDNLKIASSFAEVTVPCAPQPSGLLGWWTGDATTANETGGTAASLANGATYTFGRVGQAFALDGSDDYVSIGSLNALDAATGITVGAWIRRDNVSGTVAGIISQWNTSPQVNNRFILYLGESGSSLHGSFGVQFSDGTVGSLASQNVIPANTWMHIAATWDAASGSLRIYKNGALDRSTTVGAGKVLAGTPDYTAKIGEWGVLRTSAYKFPGDIDEAFVANRALTATEIQDLVNASGSGWCRSGASGGGTGDSFVIEAEDFDHDNGQPVALTSVMPYLGGAASGLSAVNSIDFNRTSNSAVDDLYRIGENPNQPVVLNTAVESDRGPWEVNLSYRLSSLTGNEWFNYTRTIPTGRYRIIAAMSGSGTRPLAARLSVVTAGNGTPAQNTVEIGRFSGTAGQGRSLNRFLTLQNDSGEVLVDLTGTVTLRISAQSGDIDYLQLIPEAAPRVAVSPQRSDVPLGGSVILTAAATGTGPFTYQWRHNGVRIEAATNAVLELDSVNDADRGTYSCMVSDAGGHATGDSVVVSVVHPITYNQTIAANLPNAGAGVLSNGEGEDLYELSGNAGEWIFFDEHSGNACALQWELIAPSGTRVFHHWLGGGCGNDGDTGLIQLPESGAFRLRIFTTDASDTGYGFRVTQVPPPLTFALTLGDAITDGSINGAPVAGAGNLELPADADLYTFSATAGQRVYFDEQAGDACFTQWSLTAPDGTQIFHHWLGFGCWNDGDPGTIALPIEGTYTLRVWTIDTRFGPYAFRLWPVATDAFDLVLGDVVAPGLIGGNAASGAGAIAAPGNTDTFRFTGATGEWVFFDEISGNGCTTVWTLTSPSGTQLFNHRFGHSCWDDGDAGRFQLPEEGTYTLTIQGVGESIPEYSFALLPSGPNEEFAVSLPLDLTANQLNITETPGAGTLQNPGQQDVYTFTLTEPALIYAEDRGVAVCCIDWRLEDPDGGHVFWDRVDGYDPGRLGLSKLGTYRLRVFPVGSYREWSGPYSLKLHLLPPELPMNLAIDETVSDGFIGANATPGAGRIESAGINDIYQFTAEAGDVLYLEDLGAAQCCIDWQIRDPNNNYFMCCDRIDGNDVGRYHVSVSGTYTLYVYPAGADPNWTGTYSFRLRRVVDDEFAIALDDLVADGSVAGLLRPGAGRLELPGGYDIYTFHAEAGQLLYLEDLGAEACCIDWQIRDPNNNYLMCCDRLDGNDLGRYQVGVTGEHTIYVYQAGAVPEWLGSYSFRLRAIPPDPTFPISYDQVVAADSIGGATVEGAGTISHPGAYNLYTFNGTAGDVVYLEDLGAGQCCLDWQIRDPNNNYFMCCDRLDGSDPGRYTLGVTGTYTVYVYPAGASPDYIGNFSFQIRSIPSDGHFTVGIDEVVSADSIGGVSAPGAGRLEYAGAYDYYTFTGTAGQTLYLDDLGADRCCMYWYILRPDGNYLMCCDYMDGYDVGRYDLPLDGTYTVVVYPGGASPDYSGTYSFRLRSPQPFITRQPVDLRVLVGASAELSIAADSPFGITGYQWFRGSLPVGSSSSSLPLSGVTPLDAGDYSVVIQNSFGAVTSRVAQVIVDSTQFQVASITPAASAPSPVTALVVTFSRPVDLTTLSAEDVVLTGPGGAVPVTSIVADDAQTVRLQLGGPLPDGDYSVAIGPDVEDVDGAPMLGGVMVPLYRTDFDERVGSEWNRGETATDATISAGGIPPRFAGFHGNNALTLALANLPEHQRVRLVWDLFIIDSWDGNAHDDAFQITVGNSPAPLWRHNFSQFDFNADSFPGTPTVSGSNFSGNSWSDSIYRNLEVEFEHTSTDLSLRFAGANLQDIPDESWGIDNVRLYIPSAVDGRFLARFSVDSSGPRIVGSTPTGTVTTPVSTLTFTYSEPVDADGLSLEDISISTPRGTVTLNQLVRESSDRYRLEISPARLNTTYTLRIQPTARDAAGNLQDQDGDAIGGEVPEDVFTATFNVLVPPLITGNPSSQTILRNNPVTFSVSAQYTEPVTFQWFHDEDPIPDSNSPTLTLTDVTAADAGSYYCRVSDLGGSSPSAVANLTVQENYGTLLPATLASRDVLPTVPGNGVAIELFNSIGGGPAPLPSDLAGRTPSGTTLSPFIDFPNPGSVISVGDSFISFFQQTTTPPEQVLGLAAANFILRHRFHLRVSSDLDLHPETEEIDIDLHVGSDDGFHLTVGGVFLGQAGDRGFSWSTMPVSFAQPGLYPVELLFAANAVGASGLEFAWTTTSSAAFALVPQGALYITPDLGDQLISFEELPTGSAVTDQFLDKGIRFSTISGTPGTTDRDPGRFVPVSPTRVFGTLTGSVESPSVVDLIFVSPNSTTPATTPFVSLFVIDAEQPGTRIQAYDAVGTEIFSQNLNAGPGTQTPVSITHPQIARLRLTLGAGEDRVAVDNVTFITPVALPDLEVSALSAPSIVTSSVPFEVTWQLRNRGTVPVSGPFQEAVAISASNLGTGASVLATLTFEGTLNPGDTLTRTQAVTLPIETVGTRYFVVTTDSAETVLESGSPANNRAITGAIDVILPPRPDLAITGMVSPATATPGQTVTLTWTLSNLGTAPAVGPFTEAVGWSNNAANSEDPLPAGFNLAATTPFAGTLQPGESIPRSITFTLPLNATAGTRFPVIVTDSSDAVFESEESNNGITGNNVEVDTVLSLALSAEGTSESGGSITATLTRNRGLASAHPVTLLSSDPSEATVPASVVFPAGASSVQFLITPVLDGINDGNQTVTVSANATTTGTATATIQVIDVDQPRLTLAIDATTLTEGLSSPATLTRDPVAATDLIVSLSVTDSAQFLLPLTITIPAGQPSVSFAVISAEDTLIEPDTVQTITASASGFVSSSDSLTLVDNDTLTLELSIAPSTISEAGGAAAATGTITRSPVSSQPVFVELVSNDPTAATVPVTVVIPANAASATFPIAAVDDALVDGDQMTLISATATLGGRPPVAAAPQTVTVTDNDGPTLTLTLSTPVVAEGVTAAATGTIRRNTTTTVPLVVTLLSSDPSEATVPATVEIPVGSATATFPVDSIADATTDGSQMLTVTAMAPGFTEGTASLTVTDLDLPDLVVASVTAPPSAQTEQIVSATYRIENRGNTPAVGPFLVRIYLSTDASPGGDSLAGQFNFTGTLPPGDFFELSPSFTLPRQVGNIYPVVEVDPIRTVPELSDANNFGIVAAPIVVESAYTAVASTDITQAPANTVVPIRGSAVRRSTGAPAGNVLVSVHVVVRGLRRTLGALTDSAGNFSLNFTPLPGEAGNYSIAAAHPGAGEPTTQDQFTLIGFKVNPVGPMAIIEGESAASSTIIENLSDVPLPGLAVELVSVPPGVTVTPTLGANELPGNGQVTLTYGVAVANGITTGGLVRFRISTASGLSEDIELPVIVNALRPVLVATPTSLETGMRRGTQTTVRFDIVNRGGRGTGPLRLLAPPLPWMTIAAGAELADLAPGATNPVTLVLTPAADLPLGPYAGSLFAQGEQGSVTIPFNFRALSDANGDLRVEAVDEFTYYAEGEPRVNGATVVVFDAIAGTEIARKTTGIDGIALFQNLREDYYRIEVSAADHGSYRGTHLVEAGKTTDALAFLPRQTVRYRWTVEPIQIEDRTQITIETVFETAVPTPVVTMEPTVIDLSTVVGDETQVDLTLTNHGLVTAKNSRFQLPTHPDWEFIPLITEVGDLPARTSLTVPMTIRRLAAGAVGGRSGTRRSAGVAAGGPCVVSGGLLWDLLCGPRLNTYTAPVTFNNAGTGCGGGGGGGWIGFGGWGGGFGGGGSSSGGGPSFIFNPPDISPPELCSCDLLPKVCIEGGVSIDLGGQVERLMTAILSKLPAARLTDASMSISLSGELCTCCVDNRLSWEGNATGNASLSAQVEIGPGVAAELPFEAPAPWEDVAVSGRALAGIRLNLSGSVEATYTRECGGGEKFCVNGSALLTAFAGAEFEGNASAGMNLSVGGESGSISFAKVAFEGEVHGQIGIEGNLGAEFSWCNDSGGEISACGNLVARANIGGSLKGTLPNGSEVSREFGANGDRILAGGECGSGGDSNLRRLARSTADIEGRITEPLPADLFPVPRNEIAAALNIDRPPDAVCARVKLKLEQEAVLTRDAFRAALEIENADPATLTEIGIELRFRNEAGDDVATLFGLRPPEISGITAIDGHGTLAGNTTGKSTWVLIPTRDAAGTTPIVYRIGGSLRYRHNGVLVTVPLADVPITVYPQPLLSLQYFHQRDVYSDDPFTPEVEPSIPYALGIFVRNSGAGEARNFRITSAQPQIVENERGLLIDFQLIGTEVAGESIQPSLTANFGSIAPGDTEVARWLFTSSLQGLFIDYSARFEHIDGLGNPRLSLIDEVSIHEMIRQVEAQGAFNDGKPDFLVNDVPDLNDLPDRLYLSDGSTNDVEVIALASVDSTPSTSDLVVELTTSTVSGWVYLRVPEPSDGNLQLRRIVRSDGVELPLDKLWWTTDRTFIGMGLRPVLENILHVLDHDSTGRYTLHYVDAPPVDGTAPTSQVSVLPAQSAADIAVKWTQSDDSSGVAGVDLFVSVDDGPFNLWLSDSRLSGSLYRGTVGRRYAFYSVARDVAGNREEAPASADAATFVAFQTRGPSLSSVPNQIVAEDGILEGLSITVTDPDTPLDLVSLTAESSVDTVIPTGGITIEGNGSLRTLRIVPAANQHGVVQFTLRASDGVESSTRVFTVTVEPRNDTPVARNDTATGRPRQSLRIPVIQLLSNDTDVDADTLTVSAVAATSEAGGSVRLAGAWVLYTPPTPSPATDRFTYTASDPSGATATASVEITLDGNQGSTLSVVSIVPTPGGQIVIEFVGIPNRTYAIQRSPSLTSPAWTTLGSLVADRFGRFTFTDTTPPSGEAYYRTVDTTTP